MNNKQRYMKIYASLYVDLFKLMLVIITMGFGSCDEDNSIAINYAKRSMIRIAPDSEKIRMDVACNVLANTFEGTVIWRIVRLNDFDDYTAKILKRDYPKAQFVYAIFQNKFKAKYGFITFAVNTETAEVNFVYSVLGETEVENLFQLDYAFISELESFEERKSYLDHYMNLKPQQITELKAGDYYIVVPQILNIRKSPTQYGEKIGELEKGAKVKILQVVNDEWVMVSSNGIEGFVASDYLQNITEK